MVHPLPGITMHSFAPRPRPVPLYPLTPVLFILAGLGIVINTFITDWKNARMGAMIIMLGIPVFFWWRHLNRRRD